MSSRTVLYDGFPMLDLVGAVEQALRENGLGVSALEMMWARQRDEFVASLVKRSLDDAKTHGERLHAAYRFLITLQTNGHAAMPEAVSA